MTDALDKTPSQCDGETKPRPALGAPPLPGVGDGSRNRPSTRGTSLVAAGILALAVLIIAGPGLTDGGLGWSDAPQHVGGGVFVLEFCKALPLDRPVAWAMRFYLDYPSVGLIVYWPPGFAVSLAASFALFGVHIVTARLTVMLFAFAAGWLMFRLGRRWFGDATGLWAALLLITCPHGALWLNDVMLEWPATFWILLTVWAYQKDRDLPGARWAVLAAAAWVAAFLTKQTAGFIMPVLLVHALLGADRRTYFRRPALVGSLAAGTGLIAAYVLASRPYAALSGVLIEPSPDFWFYPSRLVEIVGLPLLPIALLGLATLIARPSRGPRGLLLLWLLAWAVFSSVIAAKEPRYFFFALVPLMFATVRFLMPTPKPGRVEATIVWPGSAARIVLLIAVIAAQTAFARTRPTGRLPNYASAVEMLANRSDADLVLIDAVRDGQFVFDNYRNPRTRGRIIPLRASKLLYARIARTRWGYEQFVDSERDIVDLLDRYGIRYIVIESALPRTHYTDADPPPREMLRRLLAHDDRFVCLGVWPLKCDDPAWNDVELKLYAYPTCPARRSKNITLSIPAMGRDVEIVLP